MLKHCLEKSRSELDSRDLVKATAKHATWPGTCFLPAALEHRRMHVLTSAQPRRNKYPIWISCYYIELRQACNEVGCLPKSPCGVCSRGKKQLPAPGASPPELDGGLEAAWPIVDPAQKGTVEIPLLYISPSRVKRALSRSLRVERAHRAAEAKSNT